MGAVTSRVGPEFVFGLGGVFLKAKLKKVMVSNRNRLKTDTEGLRLRNFWKVGTPEGSKCAGISKTRLASSTGIDY